MTIESENQTRPKREMTPTAKYLNIGVVLIILIASAYIIARIVNNKGVVLFTFHPTFMVLSYLILMSNAILIMADSSILTYNMSYHDRITAHWVVQVFAIVLIAIAQICIFTHKVNIGKDHFQTTHSIFGLITLALTILTGFGGIFTKYAIQLRNHIRPVLLKCVHSFAGIAVYILAFITMILGFNQMWNDAGDDLIKPILIVVMVIAGCLVICKSLLLLISRTKDVMKR